MKSPRRVYPVWQDKHASVISYGEENFFCKIPNFVWSTEGWRFLAYFAFRRTKASDVVLLLLRKGNVIRNEIPMMIRRTMDDFFMTFSY